jgi:aspartate/methionine/tyrosine aminotransferase
MTDQLGESTEDLQEQSSLTEWEWRGLHESFNLADGHAHYRLPPWSHEHLRSLPSALLDIDSKPQIEYERKFLQAFFNIAGQSSPGKRPACHYSSSISIEMAAKVLFAIGARTVGVISPTFDNIPALFVRSGLRLVPIREDNILTGGLTEVQLSNLDAVFLVLPNNPTGWLGNQATLQQVITLVASARKVLVVDFSFRFYSDLHVWDQYKFVGSLPNFDWILLEDTGKTWPTAEMKIGFASCSERLHPTMAEVSGELLLNVSPLALYLATGLIETEVKIAGMAAGREIHAANLVARNRRVLRNLLADVNVSIHRQQAKISLEWLKLPQRTAVKIANALFRRGVAVLPGGPFYWDDRELGNSYLRIALAREPTYFEAAARALATALFDILS